MKLPMTPSFTLDRARYDLRFTCEDCAYHDPDASACAHDWPGGLPGGIHRKCTWQDPEHTPELVFCKEFELS